MFINQFQLFIFVVLMDQLAFIHNQESTPMSTTLQTGIDNIKNFPSDFFITAIYTEDEIGVIRLNITWEEDFQGDFEISVVNYDSDHCTYYQDQINISPENKFFVFPNLTAPARIMYPKCIYNITLKSEVNYEFLTKEYQIPQCVGKICSCDYNESQIQIVDIFPKDDENDEYVVRWYNNPSFIIDDIIFKIEEVNFTSFHMYAEELSIDRNKRLADIKLKNLPPGEEYVLHALFHYNAACQTTVLKKFKVPEEKNYMIIVAVVVFLVIILGINYKQLSRYATKIMNLMKKYHDSNEVEGLMSYSKSSAVLPFMQPNIIYIASEILDDKYELPRNKVKINGKIDDGAFGDVYTGEITKNDKIYKVAIKTLRETCKEVDEFLAEIEIFKKIQERSEHENIVRLLGCCTQEQPYLMVMEYIPCGNLKSYLLKLRKQWESNHRIFFPEDSDGSYIVLDSPESPVSLTSSRFPSTPQTASTTVGSEPCTPFLSPKFETLLDNKELQEFALQIAKGMAYLESIPITHRDLAARNILVTKDKVLKISDFGLSRTGSYINCSLKRKVPFRWMALEAILEQKYNNKSDVWSFGIVLWEIGTLGALPYKDITEPFLLIEYLKKGGRLSRPEVCTDELFALMTLCWDKNPDERPSFEELVELLNEKKTRAYVDFSQLNPLYVFPPIENPESSNA